MDIRVLRYFLATAREQNITRAAETLHIAQPSLSKQLMELEAELGKQLLIRGKRRITLTADGILLRKRAEEIVALLEKTEQEIASTDQDITGTVAIGGTPRQGVLEAASALHQQYPQIRFSFHVGDAPDIIERLDHGSLDFIVLLDRPDKATYGSHPLPDVSLWGLLMKSDDPLTKKTAVTPKDLCRRPLVIAQREGIRQMLFDWAKPVSDQLDIIATYNVMNGTPVPFALYTPGLVLIIRDLLSPTIDPAVAFRPLDPPIKTSHYLAWKRYPAFSAASQKFLETVYRLYPQK
ncbi:LysR family transcriptional regulator [uncultured Megasphaera sp.]|uniref:LysR family transcriptional regulator n=1 Tax=Megasphaera massiliensis TaxID=1232428 RepID=UPI00266CA396|nr:LysR family transcriptional regulator [uncultured Megasphaera sp.]